MIRAARVLGMLALAGSLSATEGAAYLKVPQGARSTALGSAFSAERGGVESLWYNPAGLHGVADLEVTLSRMAWIGETRNDYLALGLPLGSHVALGAYANLLGTEDVYRDAAGNQGSKFADNVTVGGAALALGFGHLSMGLGGKYLSEAFETQGATGFGFDAGVQMGFLQDRLRLALAAQNLGSLAGYGGAELAPPQTFRVGISEARLVPGLVLTQEFRSRPLSKENSFALGGEYAFRAGPLGMQARLGWQSSGLQVGDLAGLAVGGGITLERLQADFAWLPEGSLGNPYRLSLTWRFADQAAPSQPALIGEPPALPAPEAEAAPADAAGWSNLGRRRWAAGDREAAIRAFEKSLEMKDDPALRAWLEKAKAKP